MKVYERQLNWPIWIYSKLLVPPSRNLLNSLVLLCNIATWLCREYMCEIALSKAIFEWKFFCDGRLWYFTDWWCLSHRQLPACHACYSFYILLENKRRCGTDFFQMEGKKYNVNIIILYYIGAYCLANQLNVKLGLPVSE